MLKAKEATKAEREKRLLEEGYPAYVTSAGWMGKLMPDLDNYPLFADTVVDVKVIVMRKSKGSRKRLSPRDIITSRFIMPSNVRLFSYMINPDTDEGRVQC